LIEILITIVVFSIGLLTVAGLQVLAKKSNYDAIQRTTASNLASDIVERMRSNPQQLVDYVSAVVGAGSGNTALGTPSPNCSTASCDADEMAAYDLWQWEQNIDGVTEQTAGGANTGGLVTPTGCIEGPVGGGEGVYTITIAWRGLTALSNPSSNTCGEDTAVYGAGNAYRRVLSISVVISPDAIGI